MLGNGRGAMHCAQIRGWRSSPRRGGRTALRPYPAAQQLHRKWAGFALAVDSDRRLRTAQCWVAKRGQEQAQADLGESARCQRRGWANRF
jgi:hypothetical protein